VPPASLFDWLADVAATLDFIHGQGYVHRDVKPDNILFDLHGNAYLSDFGIAKVLSHPDAGSRSAPLTATGALVGTPRYMAPELVEERPYDGRVDQYALAVTAHEVLSGRVPFDHPHRAAILAAQTAEELPPLHEVVPALPTAVSAAVHKSLAKDPAQRYPDCRSFADAVLAVLEDAGVGKIRVTVPGWWYARPEADPDASWREQAETPATVTLSPSEAYWLLVKDGVADAQLAPLSRLRGLGGLRSLGLSFLQQLTDDGLAYLRHLTGLEALTLSQCRQVTDVGLARLRPLVSLRLLALDETQVTDAGLAHLLLFPELRSLNLGQCRGVTDAGVAHVGALARLEKLYLAGCQRITDEGLAHLAGLTDLRLLDLSLTPVSDAGLAYLRPLTRLRLLYLVGCDRVTDDGVAHVVRLTGLQKLFLDGCRGLTDAGLRHLSSLAGLRYLGLDDTAITDDGLLALRSLSVLEGLGVRRCHAISPVGIATLQDALPGCRITGA